MKKVISFKNTITNSSKDILVILSGKSQIYNYPVFERKLKSIFPDFNLYFMSAMTNREIRDFQSENYLHTLNISKKEGKKTFPVMLTFSESEDINLKNTVDGARITLPLSVFKAASNNMVSDERIDELKEQLGIKDVSKTIVFGSYDTGTQDELYFFTKVMMKILNQGDTKVILVPRDINDYDRINKITSILDPVANVDYVTENNHSVGNKDAQVVVVRRFGVLKELYSCARYSFIGGTFSGRTNIQNPLEPAQSGSILSIGFDPNQYSGANSAMIKSLVGSSGLHLYDPDTKPEIVAEAILGLMNDTETSEEMSKNIRAVADDYLNDSEVVLQELRSIVSNLFTSDPKQVMQNLKEESQGMFTEAFIVGSGLYLSPEHMDMSILNDLDLAVVIDSKTDELISTTEMNEVLSAIAGGLQKSGYKTVLESKDDDHVKKVMEMRAKYGIKGDLPKSLFIVIGGKKITVEVSVLNSTKDLAENYFPDNMRFYDLSDIKIFFNKGRQDEEMSSGEALRIWTKNYLKLEYFFGNREIHAKYLELFKKAEYLEDYKKLFTEISENRQPRLELIVNSMSEQEKIEAINKSYGLK